MSESSLEFIVGELETFFDPIGARLRSGAIADVMGELGWFWPEQVSCDLSPFIGKLDALHESVASLSSNAKIEDYYDAIRAAAGVAGAIGSLGNQLPDPNNYASEAETLLQIIHDDADLIAGRALSYLTYRYLQARCPSILAVLRLFGVVSVTRVQPDDLRPGFWNVEIDWGRLPEAINSPSNLYKEVYGFGQQNMFSSEEFLRALQIIGLSFGLPAYLGAPRKRFVDAIRSAMVEGQNALTDLQLEIPLLQVYSGEMGSQELGFVIIPLLEQSTSPDGWPGIALFPYAAGRNELDVAVTETLRLRANGDFESSIGILLRSDGQSSFLDDSLASEGMRLTVGLSLHKGGAPFAVVGSEDGSRFEAGGLELKLSLLGSPADPEVIVEFLLENGTIVLDGSEGDSFIAKLLPSEPVTASIDLAAGVSNKRGFHLRGSGSFEVTIPLHLGAGPVKLESAHIALDGAYANETAISALIGLSASAQLGPISTSIQRVGVKSSLTFPGDDGNIAPANLEIGFLSPIGAGLSLNAGGIGGGGFLDFDEPNERYSGSLALNFGEIGLTAIGLITTRMPDGSDGFSLLVNIGVTFDPPIQLSFGFTLNGVGGLIGVNRTMEIEVLQRGVRNQTLDSILFPDPETVVANASTIISDLRSVFPPAEGRFVVGPMVKIGWGTPSIISAEIGVFLELPDPIRVVLMGQLAAALPDKETGLVVINLDILGVLDLAKEELTFQASLYDSHVLAFTMFGDAAFLLGWGNDPRFGLSLGGFHPKFTPPPPPIIFGDLKRLSISISSGKNCQLTCRAYQALTPNSLQFGARVDLYAAGGGAEVAGYMGFDALIYFSPFSFEVWIGAGVSLKYEGVSLLDVELSFLLAGPTPWLVRGKAKIKILFVSIKVGFEITWGSKEQATLDPIDSWGPFQEAVLAAGNWGSVLPEGRTIVEALRARDENAPEEIVMHPAGRIEVRQKVVPLGVTLSKSGNAPIRDHDLFDISHLGARIVKRDSEGTPITDGEGNSEFEDLPPPEPVPEYFARGQCENLDSAQRLSVPAFEKMKGGVVSAASEAIRLEGGVEHKPLEYESILIGPDRTSQRQKEQKGTLDWAEGKNIAKAGTRRRAIQRAGPRKRFGTLRAELKVRAVEEFYCIARVDDLTRVAIGQQNRNMTRILADQALAAHLEQQPADTGRLIVVPEWEALEEAA